MKRQIAGILALILLISSLSLVSVSAVTGFTVTVGSVAGQVGDEVTVPVTVSGNNGFLSLCIEIDYDSRALELITVEENKSVEGADYTPPESYIKRPCNMSWHATKDVKYNGIIANLKFKILDAAEGEYPVTVDFYKGRNGNYVDGVDLNYKEKEGTLEEFEPLNITYVNGAINVIQPVTAVTLDKDETELYIGETVVLDATVQPENASNKAVTWTSSDESVAKVDAEGKVTAVGNGETTITVETVDGNYQATCTVTVIKRDNAVSADSKIEGDNVVIDITLTGDDTAKGRVYVCLYNEKGYLCKFQSFDATAVKKVTFEDAGEYEYGKIMWWDDRNRPMCKEEKF